MSKPYTPCPFCGSKPIITKDMYDHDVVRCPKGHRRSSTWAWNETNETLLKQFKRVIDTSSTLLGEH